MERPTVREIPMNLHYFDTEVVQDIIESGFVEYINPVAGHKAETDGLLKFLITGTDAFVDLSKTYAILDLSLEGSMPNVAAGQTNNPFGPKLGDIASTKLGPINLIGHTLFKSVKVRIANQTITKGDSDYGYKAYIQTLFNASESAQETFFQICGWRKDKVGKFNSLTLTSGKMDNAGLDERRKFFSDDGKCQVLVRFHTAIFFSQKAMLPYLDIELELMRHPNHAFYLMHDTTGNFHIKITNAALRVQKFKCNPAYTAGIEAMMRDKNEPVIMNLFDSMINVYTISSGVQNYNNDTLFMGRVPKRIIIGFVKGTAYNGVSDENPFYFQHFNINYIRLLKDGLEYPQPAITPNFSDFNYKEAYHMLMSSVQADYNRDVLQLTLKEFKDGFTFFSWDMSPDQQGSLDLHNVAHKPSQIKFECRFTTALTSAIQMVVYFEEDTQLLIDYKRNVIVNQL